ncbi:aminoacyl tRNA synthase complex-interacting multifunctional protein 2 [Phymastichus coffea]|uniref:aminoacyl tRNA synthase complex-interacting multifunctional protein 2 n=1 Tax=Phymastichus coffea TaxID=108790 RepID=UPI00273C60F4|nr:aminoacyl tRNA synthase complex-interacting multifunctional protein 2 [Phymastichus coffea]
MYKLKPILALPEQIPLPKVMYELPKIQGVSSAVPSNITVEYNHQTQLPEFKFLESRQLQILEQLRQLKEQLDGLFISIGQSDVNKVSKSTNSNVNKVSKSTNSNVNKVSKSTNSNVNKQSVQAELILYANPFSRPYILIALQKIWTDTNFNVKYYCHSSISNDETYYFEKQLFSMLNDNAIHSIDITLIWKDVRDVQLVTKAYDYPLEGEANVLRYFTRLIASYNYEDLEKSYLIDHVLDLCLQLSCEEVEDVEPIAKKIANHLGKTSWFLNFTEASPVDGIVWSTTKRFLQYRVPPELDNWFKSCEKLFLCC